MSVFLYAAPRVTWSLPSYLLQHCPGTKAMQQRLVRRTLRSALRCLTRLEDNSIISTSTTEMDSRIHDLAELF